MAAPVLLVISGWMQYRRWEMQGLVTNVKALLWFPSKALSSETRVHAVSTVWGNTGSAELESKCGRKDPQLKGTWGRSEEDLVLNLILPCGLANKTYFLSVTHSFWQQCLLCQCLCCSVFEAFIHLSPIQHSHLQVPMSSQSMSSTPDAKLDQHSFCVIILASIPGWQSQLSTLSLQIFILLFDVHSGTWKHKHLLPVILIVICVSQENLHNFAVWKKIFHFFEISCLFSFHLSPINDQKMIWYC